MDVPVEEPWRDVLPLRIDDLRVLADAVVCPAEVGDAALGDGHVHVLLDLGRAHVHELRALDHRLGGREPLGDGGQGFRAFPQRLLAELVDHASLLR